MRSLDEKSWKAAVDDVRKSVSAIGSSESWNAALDAVSERLEHRSLLQPQKYMCQIDVSVDAARKFTRGLETQGYAAVKDPTSRKLWEIWYFTIEGNVSTDYEVHIYPEDDRAIISIRPA